jgi:2-amino-4-hydroxy-6-hydroxymethyldihydropteridine diphosphokinase
LKHAFVLEPLAALTPDFVDPLSGRTLAALWALHPDRARPASVERLVL